MLGPRMHHQKRPLLAQGESFKVPAGLGHAVYFMVDTGKIRDSRTFFLHDSASDETASSAEMISAANSSGWSETSVRNRRCIPRCTVAFSSNRMPDKIFSRNAGGAFHSEETGRSGPPTPSG